MGIKMVMAAIKLFLIFFFIPPGFFICASITGAETAPGQPAATVAAVRDQAEAAGKTGQWRSLSVKSPVYESDTVKTGEQGRIQLLFSDNTLYALGSNAEMKITAYHWREKDGKGTLKSRVNEGAFRVMGGAITRSSPQQFTTETPLATIGVRGSMYAGIVTPSSLEVIFQGGKGIEVFNDLGRVQIDRPDFGTRVELDKPPETPRRFSGQEIKNLRKKLAGNQGEPREKKKEKAVGPGKTPVRRQAGLPERKSRVERDLEIPPPNEFKPVVDTTEPLPEIIPDSLYRYSGKITGSSLNRDGSADTISDSIMMEVNWHDQKILARIENEDGPPIFAIGDLNGRQITSFRVIGSDLDSEPIPDFPDSPPPPDNEDIDHGRVVAISGRGQGEIIGNDYENFNIEASGKGLSIRNYPEPVFTWEFKGSGSLLSTQDLEPGGESALWQGFVSSVAENMEDPHKERRYFLNKEPEDFQLAVNGEKGTVQGGFSAGDATGSGIRLDNILVGGSLGSSFISDRSFAAVLGCPGEDCVESGQECGGLREQAGFLISAGPDSERKIAAYTTWGYWEAAYQDPVADVTYHAHFPGSRWIAGIPTPAEEINSLVDSGLIASYSGQALATKIDRTLPSGSEFRQLIDLQGSLDLLVDFGRLDKADAVTGIIAFPEEMDLRVIAGASGKAAGAVRGEIVNNDVMESVFNGAFYGPGASSIGGNFAADFPDASYIGIYGGDR